MALLVAVGLAVGLVAAGLAVREGLSAKAALSLISDPIASPLVTSPIWICANIADNELSVLAVLLLWRKRTRSQLSQVLPLAKPSLGALLGANLLPFAFALLADAAVDF